MRKKLGKYEKNITKEFSGMQSRVFRFLTGVLKRR